MHVEVPTNICIILGWVFSKECLRLYPVLSHAVIGGCGPCRIRRINDYIIYDRIKTILYYV